MYGCVRFYIPTTGQPGSAWRHVAYRSAPFSHPARDRAAGMLAFHFARGRRHVCETNLRLCFPELSERELQQLLRKTFESNGIGFVEIVIAWSGNPERYQHLANFHGLDNLKTAAAQGKGVLLIGPHLTTFEMAGFLYSGVGELNATYRANDKNPLFDALMFNGRHRSYPGMFERKEIRGAMRCLKQGRVLWYAPDQDYGPGHSVFVLFWQSSCYDYRGQSLC